jgi:hypothetical protein
MNDSMAKDASRRGLPKPGAIGKLISVRLGLKWFQLKIMALK